MSRIPSTKLHRCFYFYEKNVTPFTLKPNKNVTFFWAHLNLMTSVTVTLKHANEQDRSGDLRTRFDPISCIPISNTQAGCFALEIRSFPNERCSENRSSTGESLGERDGSRSVVYAFSDVKMAKLRPYWGHQPVEIDTFLPSYCQRKRKHNWRVGPDQTDRILGVKYKLDQIWPI